MSLLHIHLSIYGGNRQKSLISACQSVKKATDRQKRVAPAGSSCTVRRLSSRQSLGNDLAFQLCVISSDGFAGVERSSHLRNARSSCFASILTYCTNRTLTYHLYADGSGLLVSAAPLTSVILIPVCPYKGWGARRYPAGKGSPRCSLYPRRPSNPSCLPLSQSQGSEHWPFPPA